ncbi:putative GMC oxidoreductase [Annulohypoxylon maeteangense]|uniref:putative GMC oxidoreductase n=1 Tax=Annulohypoxylon maeteangense TaxID=1927788 RepID=UPI0020089FED|nr:putative GMC oxidoreductase [Annulohypoxylon maeteangense]KAI0886082.1 putative GMC oxidoreductase [Annulohypoxylon maeteangense]
MSLAYITKFGVFASLLFTGTKPFTYARHDPKPQLRFLNGPSQVRSSYDYVIVGAGTAGLTIADRLTTDGKSTVLVVENGDIVDSPRIRQVYSGTAAMGPTWSYQINSVPQVNLKNRSTAVLAGNLVGGSSAINAMMTVRGTSEDYDRWGGFFGNDSSWSWDGLLPYMKKALNFVPPDPAVAELMNITYDASYWGNNSGVYAGWPFFQWPGLTTQIEAFKDIPGVEFPPDSGAGKAGVYWFPTFMDPKQVQRSYARTGHFDGINRTNHDIVTKSHVTKVLLNDGTATGVNFWQKIGNATIQKTVKANREVILSAGAIHSPQILQLSGIGPRKLLQSAGLNTSVDLPGVGQNFQDHPMVFMSILLANFTTHPSPLDMFGNPNFTDWAQELWRTNKTGPYSMGLGNAAAWLGMPVISPERFESIASKLENQDHGAQLPADTDETVIAGYSAQMKNMAASIRSTNTAFYNHVLSGGGSSGSLIDLHPLSRGTVNINTTDPFNTEPIVDYRALSNPVDLDIVSETIMVEFLRFTKRYFFETRLKELIPRQVQPPDYVNEPEDLAGFLAENLSPSEFHPSGTCAMMPRELGGVVDESLKVYGVKNLRVVDASIMPTLPGANTCQTVYAIAEKVADLIEADR